MSDVRAELLMAMREILRNAVMTIGALGDPHDRYLGYASHPVMVVHDINQAYGWASASVRRFRPSPREVTQADAVTPWLTWLRRTHPRDWKRFYVWSLGLVSVFKLAQREDCSEKTIINRIDRSVAAIIREFADVNIPVEYLEEPWEGAKHAAIFTPTEKTSDGNVKLEKIYIGGKGFWKNGKWLKDNPRRGYAAAKAERLVDAN